MDFVSAWNKGGWGLLIAYVFYKEVWPLFANKIIPSRIKMREESASARTRELDDDRIFHRQVETERLEEIKKITNAVEIIAKSQVRSDEKMATIMSHLQLILARQEATFGVLTDGVADMRAATGVKRKNIDEETDV